MHRPSETVPEILAATAFISALPHPAAVPEYLIAVLPDIDEIVSPVDIALSVIAEDAGAGRNVSVGEDR